MKGKIDPKITYKVKQRLTKLCGGDITQMQQVLDVVCGENSGSDYEFYLAYLTKPIAHYEFENPYDLAIRACNQIRKSKLTVTTEKLSPQPKPNTTENDSMQLTLDFSATTEQSPLGLLRRTTENPEREFSVVSFESDHPCMDLPDIVRRGGHQDTICSVSALTADTNKGVIDAGFEVISRPVPKWLLIEQEISQRFGGDREKKGWLSPQYKYLDECGNSHTTTDPSHIPAVKIYGPYWTYRWFQPGKNDGNLYLGATASNKFLRFALVWEHSQDTTEILDKWFGWLGKD